jgi:DNA-binding MarR family transcriptional regulator
MPTKPSLKSGHSRELKSKAFRALVVGDRLSALTREVSRGFSRSLQVRLVEYGTTVGKYPFLRALWIEDGITQRDLAERVGVMESTASTAITSLEKAGLATRFKRSDDRKRSYIVLTKKGRMLEEALIPVGVEINAIATEGLSERDVATLRRCLLRMFNNFQTDEERWPEEDRRLLSNRRLAEMFGGD